MVDAALKNSPSGARVNEPTTAPPAARRSSLASTLLTSSLSVVGKLPFSMRSRIGWWLGYIAGCIPTRERSIAALQIERFLGISDSAALTRRVFAFAGRYILQVLNLSPMVKPLLDQQPLNSIRCDNWDELSRCFKGDRPVVVLTAHTGNWDLLAAYAIARGIPITTIGREARNPLVHEWLRTIRDSYGVETIWRSDRGGLKRVVGCLREKRALAALIDQDTRVESAFVPFFGALAKTPSSLIALGKKFDARFISAFIVNTGMDTFEIVAQEFSDDLDQNSLLKEYNTRLESIIRRFPEQWVWFHKRWRSQPELGTLSSKQYMEWLRSPQNKATPGRGASEV